MRTILSVVSAVSLALSGCVAFPELPNGVRVNISDIVSNVECEIQTSLNSDFKKYYWMMGWAAGFTFTLLTKNETSSSGNLNVSIPLVPETLTLAISGGPSGKYNSTGVFEYDAYFNKIMARPCFLETEADRSGLTGHIGAGAWLTRVANDAAEARFCPSSISHTLQFVVTINGDGSPAITGVELGTSKLGAGFKVTDKTEDDHKLSLAAKPIADGKDDSSKKQANEAFDETWQLLRDKLGLIVSDPSSIELREVLRNCEPFARAETVAAKPIGSSSAMPSSGVNPETKAGLDSLRFLQAIDQINNK